MVVCSNCRKKEAKHQTAVNVDGRLVYMSLCDACFEKLRKQSEETASLNQFSKDLTELAREDKLDPVIGRENEIDRVIHILSRRTKNNPVLIGEPGVGKTAIVEGLAQKIVTNAVPEPIRNKRLVALDLASIISGTIHRGSFEKRFKEIIDEVIRTKGQVILFLDEVHTLIGAGSAQGSMDAANMLKSYLARGELQLVGATTIKEYRIIEKDAALERRFQQIMVNEPSHEQTIKILYGLRSRYENHHKIIISNEAIAESVKLSSKYISDKFLPDKAIDLIDEAGAALRLELSAQEPENLKEVLTEIEGLEIRVMGESDEKSINLINEKLEELKKIKNELTELWVQTKLENIPHLLPGHVALVVSKSTGIPVSELTVDEKVKLQNLEKSLNKRVVGQEDAVKSVSQSIKRARAGVKHLKRPVGVFLFLGPTGVGKTHLAKYLAETLYGSDDHLIRVDMSEFNERHNVSRLIGSPPGYVGYDEGGQLTEKVRRRPFSIILFDEIEKAHHEVFNTLLQVMDEGRLTDGQGRTVDFRNTIIIMTSNVGSDLLKKNRIGFTNLDDVKSSEIDEANIRIKEQLDIALKQQFKPEFINRIDDIIIFHPLGKPEIRKIVDIEIAELNQILSENNLKVKLDKAAKEYLVENGYNVEMGVRPLKRTIQRDIENQISSLIIDGKAHDGDIIDVIGDSHELKVVVNEKVKV